MVSSSGFPRAAVDEVKDRVRVNPHPSLRRQPPREATSDDSSNGSGIDELRDRHPLDAQIAFVVVRCLAAAGLRTLDRGRRVVDGRIDSVEIRQDDGFDVDLLSELVAAIVGSPHRA